VAVLILGIIGAVIFSNLYTGLVSLGVISLIVGLAVQTPMTSFIGWLYILVGLPTASAIGSRSTARRGMSSRCRTWTPRSGNSAGSTSRRTTYSWPLFPYIWNEIRFQIAYQSDLEFVEHAMREVVEEELGSEMMKHVRVYRDLLARTPVDRLTV